MRDDFSKKIVDTISKRAGFKCSNPDCKRSTVGAHEEQNKSTIVGVAAHITAASPGGPRYNSAISSQERSSISNAIWLCVNCATLIDKDPKKFEEELLNNWKIETEKETSASLRYLTKTKDDTETTASYKP